MSPLNSNSSASSCANGNVRSLNSSSENSYNIWHTTVSQVPRTYTEAMLLPDSQLWHQAMREELNSMCTLGVWTLVDRPEGVKIVRSKWVFSKKKNPDGSLRKYKARLVAAGCNQIPNVDYDSAYSPVVRMSTVRTVLAVAAANNYVLKFMDCRNAYLNGPCLRTVYMAQPPGFEEYGGDGKPLVCLLHKGIYGLPESGKNWYFTLCQVLSDIGLTKSKADPCLYYLSRSKPEDPYFTTCFHVDDKLISASSDQVAKQYIERMLRHLVLVDVQGQLYLGLQIINDTYYITVGNPEYIKKKVTLFGLENARISRNIADGRKAIGKCTESLQADQRLYREMIGSLMFIANAWRPDILYQCTILSQFCQDPRIPHLEAAKHLFRYLKGTVDFRLHFPKQPLPLLAAVSDASWDSVEGSKSITGYMIRMGSIPLVWKSKKQGKVAHSSCEAEVIALSAMTKELESVRGVVFELCPETLQYPIVVDCDSRSAIQLVENGGSSESKHYLRPVNSVRDEVMNANIRLRYTPSEKLAADFLTKVTSGKRSIEVVKQECLLY